MHTHVHCSIMYNGKGMEATQMPISIWPDIKDVHRTQENFSHEEEGYPSIVTRYMDLKPILNEKSQINIRTVSYNLYLLSKKVKPVKNRVK